MRRADQRREAVFAIYQSEITEQQLDSLLEGTKPFTRAIAEGVAANVAELDTEIGTLAEGWSLDRIAALDKAILRVGLYEIHHREDVPNPVAINEAVELAGEYCGTDATSFVNGILSAAAGEKPDGAANETGEAGETGEEVTL